MLVAIYVRGSDSVLVRDEVSGRIVGEFPNLDEARKFMDQHDPQRKETKHGR
jgi:hypothetical protein